MYNIHKKTQIMVKTNPLLVVMLKTHSNHVHIRSGVTVVTRCWWRCWQVGAIHCSAGSPVLLSGSDPGAGLGVLIGPGSVAASNFDPAQSWGTAGGYAGSSLRTENLTRHPGVAAAAAAFLMIGV